MAGLQVPLVLLPRYTTYAGADDFVTVGMDVSRYSKASVSVWRGKLIGASPTIAFSFEESMDQLNWTTCTNGAADDPGQDTEELYTPTLTKRWFRIKVALGGTSPIGTCWAVGFLEERES